jgi:hypothetical protein
LDLQGKEHSVVLLDKWEELDTNFDPENPDIDSDNRGFFLSFQDDVGVAVYIDYYRFFSHIFNYIFIYHPTIRHYIMWATDSVIK